MGILSYKIDNADIVIRISCSVCTNGVQRNSPTRVIDSANDIGFRNIYDSGGGVGRIVCSACYTKITEGEDVQHLRPGQVPRKVV